MAMENNQIGIVSIATNKYLEFYFDLINSFKDICEDFGLTTFYLFTDRIDDAHQYFLEKGYSNIVIIGIPNLGWPDATLMRYKIFYENKETYTTDILVYLDSDMLILRNPFSHFQQANQKITFIRHPGYYFEFSSRFLIFLVKNPRRILSLVISLVKFGGIGSWETRRLFAAYVPKQMRQRYFCGGVWFARKAAFLDFCRLLSQRTSQDLKHNRIPIWHDESYLNWYASHQSHNELNSLFCSDEITDSLFIEKPFIRAVVKPTIGFHGN
jgi:hypothetical protein